MLILKDDFLYHKYYLSKFLLHLDFMLKLINAKEINFTNIINNTLL